MVDAHCVTTASGALTNAIRMAASVPATAVVSPLTLTTSIPLASAVATSALVTAAFTTSAHFVAAVNCTAIALVDTGTVPRARTARVRARTLGPRIRPAARYRVYTAGAWLTRHQLNAAVSTVTTVAGTLSSGLNIAAAVNATALTQGTLNVFSGRVWSLRKRKRTIEPRIRPTARYRRWGVVAATTTFDLHAAVATSVTTSAALTAEPAAVMLADVVCVVTTAGLLTATSRLAADAVTSCLVTGSLNANQWVFRLKRRMVKRKAAPQLRVRASVVYWNGPTSFIRGVNLAGTPVTSTIVTGALNSQIRLAGAAACVTTASVNSNAVAAQVNVSVTVTATMTAVIRMAASVVCTCTVVLGSLLADTMCVATTQGALTTAIRLVGAATTILTTVLNSDQIIGFAVMSVVTQGALTTSLPLAASVATAVTAQLTPGAPFFASVVCRATTAGVIGTALRFFAAVLAQANVVAPMASRIALASAVTATGLTHGSIRVGFTTKITGTLLDQNGVVRTTGQFRLRPSALLTFAGKTIAPVVVLYNIPASGMLDIILVPSPTVFYFVEFDPTPADTRVPLRLKTGYFSDQWIVPDSGTVDITLL